MRYIFYADVIHGQVFQSVTPPSVENFSRSNKELAVDTLRAIYVPCASLETYRNTKPWSQSRNMHGVHFRNEEIIFDTVCANYIWNRFGFKPEKAGFYTALVPNENDCDSMFMIEIRHLLNDSGGKITEGSVRADTTGGKAIRWSWQGTADYYDVYRNGIRVARVTESSYTDNNISYNVEYCYEFVPAAGRCEGPKSAKQCITIPGKDAVREAAQGQLSVSPNPASEQLHVTCGEPMRVLSLYDVTGRECLRMEVDADRTAVNVSTLSRGLYLLKVETASGTVMRKIVVE